MSQSLKNPDTKSFISKNLTKILAVITVVFFAIVVHLVVSFSDEDKAAFVYKSALSMYPAAEAEYKKALNEYRHNETEELKREMLEKKKVAEEIKKRRDEAYKKLIDMGLESKAKEIYNEIIR